MPQLRIVCWCPPSIQDLGSTCQVAIVRLCGRLTDDTCSIFWPSTRRMLHQATRTMASTVELVTSPVLTRLCYIVGRRLWPKGCQQHGPIDFVHENAHVCTCLALPSTTVTRLKAQVPRHWP
eukprot:4333461-Amphidinium_carterae.1